MSRTDLLSGVVGTPEPCPNELVMGLAGILERQQDFLNDACRSTGTEKKHAMHRLSTA